MLIGAQGKRFGEIAIAQGFISAAQLEDALARPDAQVRPLGEVMVEMGLLSPSQVAAVLKLQLVIQRHDPTPAMPTPVPPEMPLLAEGASGEKDTPVESAATPLPVEAEDALIGVTLGGCLILERLGKGGMGTTYKAHHLKLDRDVCVKVLGPDLVRDSVSLERFQREARAAARLEHPGIIQVHDLGDSPLHFIVMQYVDGKSLKEVLDERGPLGARRAAFVGARVAEALASAHAARIVHRDVKPANIMVARSGQVKLGDFGLVRMLLPGEEGVSAQGQLIGTPIYMSPEQINANGDVDERADIYSLAVVIYELASGRAPFQSKRLTSLLKKHLVDPFPSLRAATGDCPPELDALLQRMAAKDPQARPTATQTAKELRALARTSGGPEAKIDLLTPATIRLGKLKPPPGTTKRLRGSSGTLVRPEKLVEKALAGDLALALREARQTLSSSQAGEVAVRILAALRSAGRNSDIVSGRVELEALSGNRTDAKIVVARALLATGAAAEAAAYLEAALDRAPDDIDLAFELAEALCATGGRERAARLVEVLLGRRRNDAGVQRRGADFRYVALRDLEGAVSAYGRAADLDRGAFEPRQQQGFLLLELGRATEAVKALEDAVARSPDAPLAHDLLGRARVATGDEKGARSALARTLDLDPLQVDARLLLILQNEKARRWDEVERVASEGLRHSRDDRALLLALARAREQLGDLASAAGVLQTLLEKDPSCHDARTALERVAGRRKSLPESRDGVGA